MQHSYVESSLHEFKHPDCPKCGAPMWLARIEPYEPDHDQRTFECQACSNITTEIVKYRKASVSI
jgi:hypothetical protein